MNWSEVKKIDNFAKFYIKASRRKYKNFLAFTSINSINPTNSLPTCHDISIGFIASKKGVDKRAVRRNRAKRRLRSGLRIALNNFSASTKLELNLVFMANKSILHTSWDNLLLEIHAHLNFVTELQTTFLQGDPS